MQESTDKVRFSDVRLTSGSWEDAASSPYKRLAGHLTALRSWRKKQRLYLVGENEHLTLLRPDIVGMRGPMVIRFRTAMHVSVSMSIHTHTLPW